MLKFMEFLTEQRDEDLHQEVTNMVRKLNDDMCKQDIDIVH